MRIQKHFKEIPQFTRSYTHLGTQSTTNLDTYVKKVQHFVEKCKIEPQPILELEIESYALKKQLAKELHLLYKDQ